MSVPPRLDREVDSINAVIEKESMLVGASYLRCQMLLTTGHFKKNDPVHLLSHDRGVPLLIDTIKEMSKKPPQMLQRFQ